MKLDVKKIAGVVLPVIGAAVSIATGLLEKQKLDETVAKKVAEALANQTKES